MSQIWIVNSGKGGVGKTTITASMAVCLAEKYGQRVAVVDADIGLSSMDVAMDMPGVAARGLDEYASGAVPLSEMLCAHARYPSLYLVPAAQSAKPSDTSKKDFKRLSAALRERFDYILIDSPAGIGHSFSQALVDAERCLIVATPDDVSVRDAARVRDIMSAKGAVAQPGLIINRVMPRLIREGLMRSPLSIALSLGLPLYGVIEQDERAVSSLLQHKTAYECAPAVRKAIETMVDRLITGTSICQDAYAPKKRRKVGGLKA